MNKEGLAVFVTNISSKATTKTVSDFFSFCGAIDKLNLQPDQTGQSQEAVVLFQNESAAKTALLLTNALIVDKVITVVPYNTSVAFSIPIDNDNIPVVESDQSPQQQQYQQQQFQDPLQSSQPANTNPDEKSKTSVVASLIAAGYILGTDTAAKARKFDDENNISLRFKVGAESIKATANEVDNKYHLSENAVAIKTVVVDTVGDGATAVKTVVVEKAKAVDERFNISEKFKSTTDMLSQQVTSFAAKAQENPAVSSGVSFLTNFGNSFRNAQQQFTTIVQQQVQQISTESKTLIEEKEAEKIHQQPSESDSLLGDRGQDYNGLNQVESPVQQQQQPLYPESPQSQPQQQTQQSPPQLL